MSRSRRNFGAKYTTNCAIQLLKGEKEHNVRNAKNDTQQDFHWITNVKTILLIKF